METPLWGLRELRSKDVKGLAQGGVASQTQDCSPNLCVLLPRLVKAVSEGLVKYADSWTSPSTRNKAPESGAQNDCSDCGSRGPKAVLLP